MAPKTAKRTEKDVLEKDAAPKAAKENKTQTATEAAAEALSPIVNGSEKAVPALDPKVAEKATTEVTEQEPKKETGGDPLADAANGSAPTEAKKDETAPVTDDAKKTAEDKSATAANIEPAKATETTEKPETAEAGSKIAHAGIAEAKPTAEVE